MNNGALALAGVVLGIGAFVVVRANASEPSIPEPIPDPLPAGPTDGSEGGDTPAPIPDPLPASGDSERIELLPPVLQHIDLSGEEVYEAIGTERVGGGGPNGKSFNKWIVHNSLNGMPIIIYVSIDNPDDWIASFNHVDGAGSIPPSHFIIYKISQNQPMKDWMTENIAGLHV